MAPRRFVVATPRVLSYDHGIVSTPLSSPLSSLVFRRRPARARARTLALRASRLAPIGVGAGRHTDHGAPSPWRRVRVVAAGAAIGFAAMGAFRLFAALWPQLGSASGSAAVLVRVTLCVFVLALVACVARRPG